MLLFLSYSLLIYDLVWLQFFKCVIFIMLCCGCLGCVCSTSDCSREHHEGEDAQERREVVVLLERQKQQLQIGNFLLFCTFFFRLSLGFTCHLLSG